jgi:hypothetical protein
MFTHRTAIAVACVVGAACAANADSVDVKFNGVGQGTANWIVINGNAKYVFAGQLKHELSNGVGKGADLEGEYVTFCTDLTQNVSGTLKTFAVEDLENMPNSPNVPTMGADAAQAVFDIFKAANAEQMKANADKALATAFQLAVWEIVYDFDASVGNASLDVNNGDFKVTAFQNGFADNVTTYLSSLLGAVGNGGHGQGIYGVASGQGQDQLLVVPLPAPLLLTAIGLGGAAIVRRRITR